LMTEPNQATTSRTNGRRARHRTRPKCRNCVNAAVHAVLKRTRYPTPPLRPGSPPLAGRG
jgi:hypothetical protein